MDANWENCAVPWWLDESKFVPYDVYYNGTTVLEFRSYDNSLCHPSPWPANMSFAIGGMTLPSDSTVSRTRWVSQDPYLASVVVVLMPPRTTTTTTCHLKILSILPIAQQMRYAFRDLKQVQALRSCTGASIGH
jgi:hypothetical protein